MITKGKAYWAKLQEPSEEATVKGVNYKSKYSIDLEVDEEEKTKLKSLGLESRKQKDSNKEFFRFWAYGVNKSGVKNPAIRVVDAQKNPIKEEIGNGSLIKVQFIAADYEVGNNKGVCGILQQVQVLKLIPRVSDEFDVEEEYISKDTVKDEFDDDIPF